MTQTQIAIEQHGYAVFGIGDTEDAARQDAAQWLDPENADELAWVGWNPRPVDGEMRFVEITSALVAQVREQGGNKAYGDLPDGTICTLAEQDDAAAA